MPVEQSRSGAPLSDGECERLIGDLALAIHRENLPAALSALEGLRGARRLGERAVRARLVDHLLELNRRDPDEERRDRHLRGLRELLAEEYLSAASPPAPAGGDN